MNRKIIVVLACILIVGGGVSASYMPQFSEGKKPRAYVESDEYGEIVCVEWRICNDGTIPMDILIEMQVRPLGSAPLSVTHSEEKLCDPDHPENVHSVVDDLAPGQCYGSNTCTANFITDFPDGFYDVYLITADGCWVDSPNGNIAYPPYDHGKYVGTVFVGDWWWELSLAGIWALLKAYWYVVGVALLIIVALILKD